MNIKYILIGLFFFVNPNIEVIDILPDFIGALFILKGISHISCVDEKAGFARKSMLILMWVSALKTMCLFLFAIIDPSNMTWMLVFTFCFGLGETGLLIYFFLMMDRSLNYTSMVYDAANVYNRSQSFTTLSIVFIVLKAVMSVLPELVYLMDTDYGNVETISVNWDFVTYMLMAANVIIVTAVGIIFYVNSFKYWKAVGKEKDYLAKIDEKYDAEVGSNVPLLTYRAFKTTALLLVVAYIFLITLRLDGIDYLPDFVAAALFFSAALRMKKLFPKETKIIFISSSLFFAVALAEWILWFLFSHHYYTTADASISFLHKIEIYRGLDPDVDNSYIQLCILNGIKALFCMFSVASFYPAIKKIITEYTGAIPELRNEKTELKSRKIKKMLGILFVIFAFLSFATFLLEPISNALAFDVPLLIFISAAVGIVTVLYTWIFSGKLVEAIENKYMYN